MSDSAMLRVERRTAPDALERILSTLPEWFGLPEANQHYVEAASELPCYLAIADADLVVGVALVTRVFSETADLTLIAVESDWRRHNVGSALLIEIEGDLREDGVQLLRVLRDGPTLVMVKVLRQQG